MNRSWVRFPQAAQIRPPGSGWAFLYAPVVLRCCLWPRWCSGRCRVCGPGCFVCPWAAARPRAVRAASFARRVGSKPGQAPPPPTGTAARPSGPSGTLHTCGARSLMCGSARLLEARFWLPNSNSARNSCFTVSNFEFVSLELQRFREVLNNDRDKLRAKFIRRLSHRCAWSSAAGSTNPSAREAMGVLHYTKPAGGVSPACRTLV